MYLQTEEQRVLREFKNRVEEAFRDDIVRLVVYGSKARGDATEDSDIDVLVVTKSQDWKKADQIRAIGYSLDIDIGSKLSIQVLTESHLQRLRHEKFQFIQNVDREGLLV